MLNNADEVQAFKMHNRPGVFFKPNDLTEYLIYF
jgi:hypothetical protein